MSRPYTISLLNDLHEHFPDLLYRPQDFHSVQDVLQYIIRVANRNPYEIGRSQYQSSQPAQPSQPSSRSYFHTQSPANLRGQLNTNRSISTLLRSTLFSPIIHRNPIPPVQMSPTDNIVLDFINQLYAPQNNEGADINISILNDRVIVRPTDEQIEAGTLILTANQVNQDNCAICQDPIEIGQTIRMIRHCTHRFHKDCIDPWFQQHVTCPTCRHDIRELNE